MNESFNSNSTYCSVIERSNNKKVKRSKPLAHLKDITNRVQSHLEGKHLLANYEVKQYLEHFANYNANTHKFKNQVQKLRSILNIIYKRNRTFEDNIVKLQMCTMQKDPFTDFGISQDLQMLCNFKDKLEPIRFPVTNDNQSSSFHTNMLTNQNFINTPGEFDNSTKKSPGLVSHSNYTALPIPCQYIISKSNGNEANNCFNKENIYNNGPILNLNSETDVSQSSGGLSHELKAMNLNWANKENSQSYINRNRATFNNVESVSFCTDMLSGHNFINSSNEHSQLSNNSPTNLEVRSDINPDNILQLDSTQSFTAYRDKLTQQHLLHNKEHFKASDNCLENGQHNNNQRFKTNFNHSDDIFSGEKSDESIKTNKMLTSNRKQNIVYSKDNTLGIVKIGVKLPTNSKKGLLTGKTSQQIDYKMSSTNKKIEKIYSMENMCVDDPLSQYSNKTNLSRNSSLQLIISDSFYDRINIDSNNDIVDHQRMLPMKTAIFKELNSSDRNSLISDNNDVITSTEYSDQSTKNISKAQIVYKGNFYEKSTSVFSNKTTFEDSCNDLCQLTTKLLKIVDDRDVEENGGKCVEILKNLTNAGNKKDVQEIGELGTNSTTWEESSEDIENMGQIHQELSGLLIDVLESIDSQEHDNKDFDNFETEAAKYLDPVDVIELDLKTLLQSNTIIIQDISKSFKKQLLTDHFFQSNNTSVTDDCFDWRNIN